MHKETWEALLGLLLGFCAGWVYFLLTMMSLGAFWLQWRETPKHERFAVLILQLFRPMPYVLALAVACIYWGLSGQPNYWFWLGFLVPVVWGGLMSSK